MKCALNTNGRTMIMEGFTQFTLDSAQVAGIHRNDLSVEFTGLLGGRVEWTETIVVSALAPTLYVPLANGVLIDELQMRSFGGTIADGSPIDSVRFGFDDVTVTFVPEPSTALLFGLGLGGISALRRRRA